MNNGVIGSESMIVSNVSDHAESRYALLQFSCTLMARKFKNVAAIFPERVKTKVLGVSGRFNLVQEPSVKAHKSPSSSKNGDQFTFSHPIVQTQTLKSNSCIPKECIVKDKRHEFGQRLNPNTDLDQGLNPASSDRRAESQIVQVTNSNIESSGVVPGSVSCSLEGQYDLQEVNQHYDTVQFGLGVNFVWYIQSR